MSETHAGRFRLDWRANTVTVLASVEVELVVMATDDGWDARGRVVDESAGAVEGFALLCATDPLAELRLDDGSTVLVEVHLGEGGELVLTEPATATGPATAAGPAGREARG